MKNRRISDRQTMLFLFIVLMLSVPVTANPGWWNSSWSYRQPVTIENLAENLTDYQVNISLNATPLYEAGKLNSTCEDIRFTYYNSTSGTETGIPFWTESCTTNDNSTLSKFWVNVTYLENNTNTTVYMYYENPSATHNNTQGGNDTFLFFDDFLGSDVDWDKWDESVFTTGTYSRTVSDSWIELLSTETNSGVGIITGNPVTDGSIPFIVESKCNIADSIDTGREIRIRQYLKNSTGSIIRPSDWGFFSKDDFSQPQPQQFWGDWTLVSMEYTQDLICRHTVSGSQYIWYTGIFNGSQIYTNNDIQSSLTHNYIEFAVNHGPYGGASSYISVDWTRVRKYTSPEPFATLDSEESIPTVTLVSPPNSSYDTDGNVTFICNASSEFDLTNMTLKVWNSTGLYYNDTTSVSGTSNQSEWNLTGMPDESYEWNCLAFNNLSHSNYATSNYSLTIDTIAPTTNASAVISNGSNYTFNTWTNSAYVNVTLSCNDSGSGCDTILYCTDTDNNCEPSLIYNLTWWNSSWSYRQPLLISDIAGDQTGYQVKLELNSSNTGQNLDWGNEGNDTRFTYYNSSSRENMECPHWIENWNSSSEEATVWVKVPFLENNTNTTVYRYYGNPSASSASNGTNTFLFFDDFDDINKWTELTWTNSGSPTVDVSGGYVELTTDGAYESGLGWQAISANPVNTADGFIFEISISTSVNTGLLHSFQIGDSAFDDRVGGTYRGIKSASAPLMLETTQDGTRTLTDSGVTPTVDEWHKVKIIATSTLCEIYEDDMLRADSTATIPTVDLSVVKFTLRNWQVYSSNRVYKADDIIIRKYASTEPAFSSVGAEENSSLIQITTEGISYIRFQSSDTAGNLEDVKNETIRIDALPPIVQFVSPTTAAGNRSQSYIEANVTASDAGVGLANITIYLYNSDGSLNQSNISGESPFFWNITSPSEGTYYLNATANDTFGYISSTETRAITLDITKPSITINSPGSNSMLGNRTITINLTATDLNLNYTNISVINSTGVTVNSTINTTNGTYTVTLAVPMDGVYNVTATAYDAAGNSNTSMNTNITVDTTPPNTTANAVKYTGDSYEFGTWTRNYVNVSLSCYDSGVGCDIILYCTNTSNSCEPYRNQRQEITIENTAEDLTNYQVRIDLNSSNVGASFNWTRDENATIFIYYNSSSGTESQLSHWIESWNSTAQEATIWVKVPFLENDTNTTVYIYYGNPNASSASNGTDTFLFFDDFEGGSLDTEKWTDGGGVTYTVTDSELRITAGTSPQLIDTSITSKTFIDPNNYILQTKIRGNPNTTDLIMFGWSAGLAAHNTHRGAFTPESARAFDLELTDTNGGVQGNDSTCCDGVYSEDTYYVFEVKKTAATTCKLFVDTVEKLSITVTNKTSLAAAFDLWETGDFRSDWILVRKYASTEPTVTLGTEESPTSVQITTEGVSYIRFRSNDTLGNLETTKSEIIKIDNDAPQGITLLKPENNTRTVDTTPLLNWTTISDERFGNYTIQLSYKDSGFGSIDHEYYVTDINENHYQVTDALEIGRWYWRVVVYDDVGNGNVSDYFVYYRDFKRGKPRVSVGCREDYKQGSEITVFATLTAFEGESVDAYSYCNISIVHYNGTGMTYDLNPTPMTKLDTGYYYYKYQIASDADTGTYGILVEADPLGVSTQSNAGFHVAEWTSTIEQINETVNKIWERHERVNGSVIKSETVNSWILNSTSNISIEYNITVPLKEGYTIEDYLPIRINYWFVDSQGECVDQGRESYGVEPYCNPLVAQALGRGNSSLIVNVTLRPSLPAGDYSLIRELEIDPNQVWISYGQGPIGIISVIEDTTGEGSDSAAVTDEVDMSIVPVTSTSTTTTVVTTTTTTRTTVIWEEIHVTGAVVGSGGWGSGIPEMALIVVVVLMILAVLLLLRRSGGKGAEKERWYGGVNKR